MERGGEFPAASLMLCMSLSSLISDLDEIFLLLHLIMCNQLFLGCFLFVALRSVQPQISCWIYLFLRRQRAPNPKIENDRRRPTGA